MKLRHTNIILLQMEDEEYPSDSDQSDEDYNPYANDSDVPSEVESDGEPESGDDDFKPTKSKSVKPGKRKRRTPAAAVKRKVQKSDPEVEVEEKANGSGQSGKEGNDEDEEKRRVDALWADFLGDTPDSKAEDVKPIATDAEPPKTVDTSSLDNQSISAARKEEERKEPERKIITEIFEFAGEQVEVQKLVEVDKEPVSVAKTGACKPDGPGRGAQRGSPGGIGSILGQLGKPRKISTLEKTKLDWNNFKVKEGIDEELTTHNKGKGGFLERQDFLERTDLRQFEIEKSQRQTSRKK